MKDERYCNNSLSANSLVVCSVAASTHIIAKAFSTPYLDSKVVLAYIFHVPSHCTKWEKLTPDKKYPLSCIEEPLLLDDRGSVQCNPGSASFKPDQRKTLEQEIRILDCYKNAAAIAMLLHRILQRSVRT